MGILPRDRGRVVVGGYDLDGRLEDIRRISCLVPQNLSFYSALTAGRTCPFSGLSAASPEGRCRAHGGAVAAASLESFLDKRVETYSGGMKRRLNLAIGLLGPPGPVPGRADSRGGRPVPDLDPRDDPADQPGRWCHGVYASHYMDEVEQVADDLVISTRGGSSWRAGATRSWRRRMP